MTNEEAEAILRGVWASGRTAVALMAGAAALSEVERLRRELAELRKPVEVLPAGIAEALKNCDIYGDDAYGVETPRHRLEAAILKFANERGGVR